MSVLWKIFQVNNLINQDRIDFSVETFINISSHILNRKRVICFPSIFIIELYFGGSCFHGPYRKEPFSLRENHAPAVVDNKLHSRNLNLFVELRENSIILRFHDLNLVFCMQKRKGLVPEYFYLKYIHVSLVFFSAFFRGNGKDELFNPNHISLVFANDLTVTFAYDFIRLLQMINSGFCKGFRLLQLL